MNQQSLLLFQDRYKRAFTILNWSVPALLGIFVFCRPFPYTTAITNISFYLAIFIALVLIIFKRINFVFKTPLTYPLIIFLFWSALSIFWSLNRENSTSDVQAHLLNHIVLYFLLVSFFYTEKRLNLLAWIVVASATIFSIAGMVYYYIIADSPLATRFGNLLNSVNVSDELPGNMIGTLTITAIVFCLYFLARERRLYIRIAIASCALVTFCATLLTQSRGTLFALIIAGTILLLIKNKKIVPFFLFAMVVIVIFSPFKSRLDVISFSERLKINHVTMEVIKDYPLLGIGFGMRTFNSNIDLKTYIKKMPERNRPSEINTPHNWLLDITLRTGLIGLLLFLSIIFVFGKMCREIIRHARDDGIRDWGVYLVISFVAYFIMGLSEPLFLFRASASIFYIFLAMVTILWRLNQCTPRVYDQLDTGKKTIASMN